MENIKGCDCKVVFNLISNFQNQNLNMRLDPNVSEWPYLVHMLICHDVIDVKCI